MKSLRSVRTLFWSTGYAGRCFTAAACLVALLANGCAKKEKPVALPPPAVEIVQVIAKDTPIISEYVAQTQSSQQVSIQARVNGFLEKRAYTEGSIVKAGTVLFLMDKKPFQAQVDAASAALDRQKAAMKTARLNLDRTKPLTEKNALSKKDLDDATGAYESAAAAVEAAKAQLLTARLNLSYCTITSPVNGITSAALQQEGAYINTQNSLLTTVAVLSPIWVNFSLSENELKEYSDQIAKGQIRPPKGQNYEIEIVQVDGSIFPHSGRITFADPSFNPQTGTFLLRASVNNPKGVLRPNQYVRARIKGAIRPNAILVPQRAVQQGAKGHFVWVVDRENKAESRPVVVGELMGNDWFISEGLKAGEKVVVDGGMTLRPGIQVVVKQAGASQSGPAAAEPKPTPAKKAD
ncbi:efflux RND transporter periplasmic adaptor subunit [Pelobacter propionicus]|uniref:Efflux transporter, RND family, MFP subunit n=1 Tax=Pelobacter propionicus (strain DSM 2379 / NBRC 103807 / OttBd1) TaxID=338966 RepID=A1AL24_PELPD|nr:efflux RND transporter periplasmic adaptor subunit [Pelobacter propionicus]ABK98044.1 efflux transporter, RND family, MFP subunit [Pelobacter propionicus DSM 2379]